ncbi:MAG: ROK family protein [Clostridiales bacterium]|nr:ROK family protein [Clostridiales bacterium]
MRVGIDVGGSHIGLGIIDRENNLIIKEEKDYDIINEDMSEIVIRTIIDLLKQVLLKQNLTIDDIEKIGIAFPGTTSSGIVIKAENLGIINLNIEERLRGFFNTKIVLENDAKCAAIAEKQIGSLKDYDDALFVIIGTGVGGAAFLQGKLLKPIRYSGFEVGHMVIKETTDKCNCGRRGCFEIYGSMKRFKEKIKQEFKLDSIDGKIIRQFMFYNIENQRLKELIDEYIENLVIGIANLVNIFEPQAVSIGGSFGHYEEILLPKLKEKLLQEKELYNKGNVPEILIAELRNDAGIIGAAML